MIKAVLFDVDGVLLHSFEANYKFYSDLARVVGYPPPTRERHAETLHIPMWDKIADITGLRDKKDIQKIFDLAKSDAIPYDYSLIGMPEGIEEVIPALSLGFTLGIVTSRIRARVFVAPYLEKLSHHFSTVVGYEDTENHKPHPEPLLCAAENIGVDPTACIYVGDTESDMIAAHASGMRGVHFTKNDQHHGDERASSFKDLLTIIAKLLS